MTLSLLHYFQKHCIFKPNTKIPNTLNQRNTTQTLHKHYINTALTLHSHLCNYYLQNILLTICSLYVVFV